MYWYYRYTVSSGEMEWILGRKSRTTFFAEPKYVCTVPVYEKNQNKHEETFTKIQYMHARKLFPRRYLYRGIPLEKVSKRAPLNSLWHITSSRTCSSGCCKSSSFSNMLGLISSNSSSLQHSIYFFPINTVVGFSKHL